MKSGVRALGIAESYQEDASHSTLAGAVVRADGVLEDLDYVSCTVGGTDATDAVVDLLEGRLRPDVRYVFFGAVAPAWYNVLDLSRIAAVADRPVLAVTFEASPGLEPALRDAFSGRQLESRLETYRSLPDRYPVEIGESEETVYVRHLNCDREEAAEVVDGFTLAGGRPEPIRVASVAARAGDRYVDEG
ncbi:DUF99 family protein [Natrarchaeobaculum aegyptiacum]|uniref:UPF0215 protein B1756_04250 n=1 Tax=Natrarchaeobaculum aegyptiacum TaxID=745377 RepID=A0A2Z2HVI3_9EURY|nr:DUF99 family protein [Natrarchaeobaculum aegyptiacum]ARS89044.1 hypothetical protein B1756_04250 [Natrarchaeobaculum aegyptiacum]